MKNSKLRRVLLLASCAVMLVCLSVGATLAYLTATTGTVTNTFSVGKVTFDTTLGQGLDEALVNDHGQPMKRETTGEGDNAQTTETVVSEVKDATRVTSNSYKLLPAHDYVKDPTIHVAKGSDEFYLFIKINKTGLLDNDNASIEAGDKETGSSHKYDTIATQMSSNGWMQLKNGEANVTGVYVYTHKAADGETLLYTQNTLVATQTTDYQIFAGFSLKNLNDFSKVTTENLKIEIKAYAVQADGFDTALAAWNATFGTTTNAGGVENND